MNIPENLKYTKDHEWVKVTGDEATVGITDFAQGELGDIVYVEVETVGDTLDLFRESVAGGFYVNLSADNPGHADTLSDTGLAVATLIPQDTPNVSYTPAGRKIVACPDKLNCSRCGMCSRTDRGVIIGFRPKALSRAKIEKTARGLSG